MRLQRHLFRGILSDLPKKMVMVSGPRQVGKTDLACHLKKHFDYLNWDIEAHRSRILDREFGRYKLLIFDEIHKYKKWRELLKSLVDRGQVEPASRREIMVTGSGRLDLYGHGGDSLQGRYMHWRLLPLSLREIGGSNNSDLLNLLTYSGFPEPFLEQSQSHLGRWSRQYRARLVREDIRDLEMIQDLGTCELLLGRLPACVGNPLSVNSLREDLRVAHKTVAKWLLVFEKMYTVFRLSPFGSARIHSVKKEQKAYLFIWTEIEDESLRFENLVAVHLLKHVYYLQDSEGRDVLLQYFRDTNGREIDFVVSEKGQPLFFVECKLGDQPISAVQRYLSQKFPGIPNYQVHLRGKKNFVSPDGIRVCPAAALLNTLT